MKTKWKKLTQRILSSVLALAMMCSILPAGAITASAANATYTINTVSSGVKLSTGTKSNTTNGLTDSMSPITKTVGEAGYYQRCPYSGVTDKNRTTYYYVDEFVVASSGAVTVSNTGIIGNITIDLEDYKGNTPDGTTQKAITLNYTALSAGTTTVTFTYYYTFNVSGVQNGNSWYKETQTFTVNVTASSATYTLAYNSNGGTGSMTSTTATNTNGYANLTAKSNAFTAPSGYVFDGWNTSANGTGTSYAAGASVYVTGTTTLYAQWALDSDGDGTADKYETYYTVTYTDGVEDATVFADQSTTVEAGANTPSFSGSTDRANYIFAGWSPSVSSTVQGDATYVAIWAEDFNGNGIPDEDETKYTVTYKDGANGEVFADVTFSGRLVDTTTPAFSGNTERSGYIFAGWNDDNTGKVTGDATYTATWKADTNGDSVADEDQWEITLNYGDDSETTETDYATKEVEDNYTLPATAGNYTKAGYVLTGWSDGTSEYALGATVTIGANTTFTGVWGIDTNGDGDADATETQYTVIYTDGLEPEESVFTQQTTTNLVVGNATPDFDTEKADTDDTGNPTRTDYIFTGWNPEVVEKIVADAATEIAGQMVIQYTATWAEDTNGNGIADSEESYTISWVNDQSANTNYTTTETAGLNTVIDFTQDYRTPTDSNMDNGDQAFLYWVDADGNQYGGTSETDTYIVTADVTFTAVWEVEDTAATTDDDDDDTDDDDDDTTVADDEEDDDTTTTDDDDDDTTTDDDDDTTTTDDDDDDTTTTTTTTTVTTVDVVDTTVIEDTAVPATAVTTAATTATTTTADPDEEDDAEEAAAEPATEIEADEVPLAAAAEEAAATEIEEEEVPLVATAATSSWALINLILAIATAATSIVMLAGYFLNRRDEEEGNGSASRLLSLLPALLGVVCFALTQNMANPMAFVDKWTLAMVLIALIQIAVVIKVRKDEGEQEDSTFA